MVFQQETPFSYRMPMKVTLGVFLLVANVSGAPVFDAPPSGVVQSEEGKAVLAWSQTPTPTEERPEFVLQQADDAAFTAPQTLYQGPDQGTVVTGLTEGTYYYRVRRAGGRGADMEWSSPLVVEVKYPEPRIVVFLFIMGVFVFLGTVGAVIVGHCRMASRREDL